MPFDVVLVIKRLSGKKRYMYHMYHSNLEIPREMNSRLFPLDIIKGSESRKLCKNRQRKKPAAAVHRVLKYEVLPLFKVLRQANLLPFLATITYLFAFDTKLLMIT